MFTPDELIRKILETIDDEYEFAKYCREEHIFKDERLLNDEEAQIKYALWAGGRLTAMEELKQKIREIIRNDEEES